jgi:hypothetical protein
MKSLPAIITVSVSAILVSCSQSKNKFPEPPPIQEKPQIIVDATFPLPETPQKTCGDPFPKAAAADSISFYPVIVEYSKENLDLVKKHFCEDALKHFGEKAKKDIIQVASFSSREKADEFKIKLAQHFSGVEVGDPTIVKSLSGTVPIESSDVFQDPTFQKSGLTPKQSNKLISAIGRSKDFNKNNVIVLPTNLPPGYVVDELSVVDKIDVVGANSTLNKKAGYYSIVYKNPYGACFVISGGEITPKGATADKYEEVSNIQSPALGSIKLGLTDAFKEDGSKSIVFAEAMGLHLKGRNEYDFRSPFLGGFTHAENKDQYHESRRKFKDCKMMNLQDAKKVVESLQFINP